MLYLLLWVYVSFALSVCLGFLVRKRPGYVTVFTASLAGSVLFFLLSNFGVWLDGTLYPLTTAGLYTCYVAAIPFFRNTLLGDLFYAGLLFGSFAWAQQQMPVLRAQTAPVEPLCESV